MKIPLSMNNLPIGIFDSGLGGLTVLKSLEQSFPKESFIYFGDTANVPYGNKSAKTIIQYSKKIIKFLQNRQVKMIIVACNTSSALALKTMKNSFNIPILGVIDPVINYIENVNNNETIVVLGTQATIESKAYSNRFKQLNSSKNIIEKSCPLFVPLIEEGLISGKITETIIKHYISEYNTNKIKQFILGCTHYPILIKTLQKVVGENVRLITSGEALIPELTQFLDKNMFRSNVKKKETQFYVSDLPQKFHEIGSRFLGHKLKNISHVLNF